MQHVLERQGEQTPASERPLQVVVVLDASSYMEPFWASLYESCVYPALSFLDLPRSKPDAPSRTEFAMVADPANHARMDE